MSSDFFALRVGLSVTPVRPDQYGVPEGFRNSEESGAFVLLVATDLSMIRLLCVVTTSDPDALY